MIAGRFVEIAAADHTQALAIVFAEVFGRQLEQQIGYCNFIQFNALAVRNDILIVIAVCGGNDNMVEIVVLRSFKLFQAPVAGDEKSHIHGIFKVDYACPVVYPALYLYGRCKAASADIRKLVRTYCIRDVTRFSDDTEKLFKVYLHSTNPSEHHKIYYTPIDRICQ